jgi:O-antigen/teichoic acid export membrane protein
VRDRAETESGTTSDRSRSMRDTLILASSSAASFLVTLVRTKLIAVAWGPLGVGATGMMQAAMSTATLVCGVGVDAVVTRELAKARGTDAARTAAVYGAGTLGAAALAVVACFVSTIVMFVAKQALGFQSFVAIAIVALGVGLSVLGASLRGVLAGLGDVYGVARLGILSSLASALLVAGLVAGGSKYEFMAWAVVAVPASQLAVAAVLVLRGETQQTPGLFSALRELRGLMRAASLFAVAGVFPVLGQLLARALARDSLGSEAFGFFQASMALAATSVSVLAGSVGPSVLPRLSAVASEPSKLSETVNEQIRTYLLLFAPVALTIALMPGFIVRALFSDEFIPVGEQLSWQLSGEVLRLPSWVMATALTARGRSRAYLALEFVSLVALVVATVIGTRAGSPQAIGAALSGASFVQFAMLILLVRVDGIRLSGRVWLRLCVTTGVVILLAATLSAWPVVRLLGYVSVLVSSWHALKALQVVRSSGFIPKAQ